MNQSARAAQARRLERAEAIVTAEWEQFQRVNNDGGPAECQGNWPMFHQMRISQFLTWPLPLLESYLADLTEAAESGRNLLTEKYGRMMATTEPERFADEIEPFLPELSPVRVAVQERIVATQVAWAEQFAARYPALGAGMRVLRTEQDTLESTSLETYLRGELGTYSETTLTRYRQLVEATGREGGNLTEQTVRWTVVLGGFDTLEEAEAAQAR